MTTQTRRYIELKDILALRFECRKCGGAISIPLADWQRIPSICPNCTVEFTGTLREGGDSTQHILKEFRNALRNIARIVDNKPLALSLEIPGDKEKAEA